MVRRLAPDEKALWQKVVATVRPLNRQANEAEPPAAPEPVEASSSAPSLKRAASKPSTRPPTARPPAPQPGATLDGSWDRRLSRGVVQPDLIVDLHGHNLATAYALLDARLEQAVAMGARVLLLITGKAPEGDRWPVKRGAIRAAVGDWLAASRHASNIAAVRAAHPRHGGAGALYIILRRPRTAHTKS
jgi:DNA-nicking Smr family endonuclease